MLTFFNRLLAQSDRESSWFIILPVYKNAIKSFEMAWYKSGSRTPGPGTSIPCTPSILKVGPRTPLKFKNGDPLESLKVKHQDLLQSLKVGPQDSFQNLKVGPPHLSLINSFFQNISSFFTNLIFFAFFK